MSNHCNIDFDKNGIIWADLREGVSRKSRAEQIKYFTKCSYVVSRGITEEETSQPIDNSLPQIYASLLQSFQSELGVFNELRNEVSSLKKRLDKIEADMNQELKLEAKIKAEIAAIEVPHVTHSKADKENWMPSSEEVRKLQEED